MKPRVKEVMTLSNYRLHIEFNNGERGIYDCTPLLEIGVFKELKDKNYFQQAKVCGGTVVWPHEQDICPDTLHAYPVVAQNATLVHLPHPPGCPHKR